MLLVCYYHIIYIIFVNFCSTLTTEYSSNQTQIVYLFDHSQRCYRWAHNLVSIHYSDDQTDYPVLFQLWKPVDLDKLERGLLAADVKLEESKYELKKSALRKWRQSRFICLEYQFLRCKSPNVTVCMKFGHGSFRIIKGEKTG